MHPALWLLVGLGAVIAVGNLAILVAHLVARLRLGPGEPLPVAIRNGKRLTPRLWRSGKPSPQAYRELAAAGVETVLDLRAEGGLQPDERLGMRHVPIPVRDGEVPSVESVARLRRELAETGGLALIHCSAGVGRTSCMVVAVRVLDQAVGARRATWEALAVGPPSLEQIAFMLRMEGGARPPQRLVVMMSRMLDGPRSIWSWIRGWWRSR